MGPPNRYPNFGPSFVTQANPANGGHQGVGADALGLQIRDWGRYPILARINGRSGSAYGFTQVIVGATGATTDVTGGIQVAAATTGSPRAYEANGLTSVPNGTVVELWPQYSAFPAWTFVAPVAVTGTTISTTCKTVAIAVTCSTTGTLLVTYDLIRVVDATCP